LPDISDAVDAAFKLGTLALGALKYRRDRQSTKPQTSENES
jgi:hypothetical protein